MLLLVLRAARAPLAAGDGRVARSALVLLALTLTPCGTEAVPSTPSRGMLRPAEIETEPGPATNVSRRARVATTTTRRR